MHRRYPAKQMLILLMVLLLFVLGLGLLVRDRVLPTVAQPVYQGDESRNRVALTVNVDWGEEHLPAMLEVYGKYDVQATFFVTGRWADLHPDLVRTIKENGHEIGNHGYGHPHPDHLSVDQNRADIIKAENAVYQACGYRTTLYAPPYGERSDPVLEAAEKSGYTVVLWSLDTVDWKSRNADAILDRIKGRIHNGAIILMHPTEATVEALAEIIPFLESRDLEAVTVSTLIKGDASSAVRE